MASASLRFKMDRLNIINLRKLIEKFSLFLNRSETLGMASVWFEKRRHFSINPRKLSIRADKNG